MDKASIKKKAAELGVGDVEGKTIKVLARECVMRAGKFETFSRGGGLFLCFGISAFGF